MGFLQSTSGISIQELEAKARMLRLQCIQLAHAGREGHLNGALSCLDVLLALYCCWLRVTPEDPYSQDRDRLIFSKGHACLALYTVLADQGFIPREWLAHYAQNDSPLPSHPCTHMLSILEWSSGSLGHGLNVGTGMAYAMKLEGKASRIVVLLSDGECNEGSTWEAAMFAAAQGLDNVLAIVDYNGIQSVGRTDSLTGFTSFEKKFLAFGWQVKTVDGHQFSDILGALEHVPLETGKPTAIIANTVAGKGVSFMENQVLWHYRVPSVEDVKLATEELSPVSPPLFQEAGQ